MSRETSSSTSAAATSLECKCQRLRNGNGVVHAPWVNIRLVLNVLRTADTILSSAHPLSSSSTYSPCLRHAGMSIPL